MTRLLKLGDGALAARIDALRSRAADLQARLHEAIEEAERAGHQVPTSRSFKRLTLLLRRAQSELKEAEKEQARRRLALARRIKPLPLTRYGRMSSVLGPKLTTT